MRSGNPKGTSRRDPSVLPETGTREDESGKNSSQSGPSHVMPPNREGDAHAQERHRATPPSSRQWSDSLHGPNAIAPSRAVVSKPRLATRQPQPLAPLEAPSQAPSCALPQWITAGSLTRPALFFRGVRGRRIAVSPLHRGSETRRGVVLHGEGSLPNPQDSIGEVAPRRPKRLSPQQYTAPLVVTPQV